MNPRSQSVRAGTGRNHEVNCSSDSEDENPYKAIRFDFVNVNDFECAIEKLNAENTSLRNKIDKNNI